MKNLLLYALLVTIYVDVGATNFNSDNNVIEECLALPQIPGGKYSKKDVEEENEFCKINFYDKANVALCPKTNSTSPGTMVYKITDSGMSQAQYEAQSRCGGNKKGHVKLAKFKNTMSVSGTSATFSPSSLLYYHLSRYFNMTVDVPVAVYRTIDKKAHFDRVTKRAHEGKMGKSKKNKAGWEWMYKSEPQPSIYPAPRELFTTDRTQIYGVMLDGGGEHYGAEINGIRGGGYTNQNERFQETPAFLALRSEKPLTQAIAEGLQLGLQNSTIKTDMGAKPSDLQMALWMKELTEITLLDYILSQQDRVGNIDYKWFLYTPAANGKLSKESVKSKVARKDMQSIAVPAGSFLIQETKLNDNDAGGKIEYRFSNWTAETRMFEKIRHINIDTYRKLLALNADLQSGERGILYKYFSSNFKLDQPQLNQMIENTARVTSILHATCVAKKLNFDLYSAKQLLERNGVGESNVNCDLP